MAMTDMLFSTEEAATRLGLTPGRICQICRWNGVGKKKGRDWILTERDLDRIREMFPREENSDKTD